jgi:acyl-CoA thioesterase-1
MAFKAALGFFASLAITALLSAGIARAEPIKLVGFGDSLMAGYQLPAADAFPVK